MKLSAPAGIATAFVALSLALAGCEEFSDVSASTETEPSESSESGSSKSSDSDFEIDEKETQSLLDGLEVVDKFDSNAGYDRDLFPHWEDATEDLGWDKEVAGCNTRWATLWNQGHDLVWDDQESCMIGEPGYWIDQYGYIDSDTGEMDEYVKSGDPSKFDIDHIVALGATWKSGMNDATEKERREIANDPLNLEVSDLRANRSKGDQMADTYLPPGAFRCEYVSRYIQVKDKYDLVVIQKEKDRLSDAIQECA